MKEPIFIVNPNSNKGKTKERWENLLPVIKSKFPDSDFIFTMHQGHAIDLVTDLAKNKNKRYFISVGGDGTLNEIANGLMNLKKGMREECFFSYLNMGTGGDFRKSFGSSSNPEEHLNSLLNPNHIKVDVGTVAFNDEELSHNRHFVNICSFGLSGWVDVMVPRQSSKLPGAMRYIGATLGAYLKYRPRMIQLTVDSKIVYQGKIMVCAIANGQYFGGGMRVAPDARVDDGEFQVVVMEPEPLHEGLKNMPDIYNGEHLKNAAVKVFSGKKIEARTFDKFMMKLDIDGEAIGHLDSQFSIQKSALNLIY